MISWRILSCPTLITVYPARFAGTWSRYSKSAIPQLISAAMSQPLCRSSLRCAYQANVMKTFDATSRRMVLGMGGMSLFLVRATGVVGGAADRAEITAPCASRAPSDYLAIGFGVPGNSRYGFAVASAADGRAF